MNAAVKDVTEALCGVTLLAVDESVRWHRVRTLPPARCACPTSLKFCQEYVLDHGQRMIHTLSVSVAFLSFHSSLAAWKTAIRGHEKSLSTMLVKVGLRGCGTHFSEISHKLSTDAE
jgi:hypothetical protein